MTPESSRHGTAHLRASVGAHVRDLLPGARDYRELPRTWRFDLVAGITVGVVALPLALAFGVASGAGPASGLVTAIVAGLVAAVFGGSNVQVSGPTGAMVVVLAPIIAKHGLGALAAICLLAGAIVLVAGILHLGRTISYIPWPVIEGFTLGIAAIIFLQQVPTALGAARGASDNALLAALEAARTVHWPEVTWSLGIVAVVVLIMVGAPRIHPRFPGSLVAIITVGALSALLHPPVDTIGALPAGLPAPTLPQIDPEMLSVLLGPAFAIAVLAAIESLLSARVASTISTTGPYDADRELVGQGLASIACGFFGGMPATGAIARTAVNVRSGGRTRLAAVVHAVVLLGVSFAAVLVEDVPLAALAGVLMVTAYRMISIATLRALLGSTPSDAVVFAVTALVTVSVDLMYAVGIGVAAAGFFALRKFARLCGVHREHLPEAPVVGDERIALLRLEGAFFFGAAERVLEQVGRIDGVEVVILRMSQIQLLDATGAQVITEICTALGRREITVVITGLQTRHVHLAERIGVVASLGDPSHLTGDLPGAIEHARRHVRDRQCPRR